MSAVPSPNTTAVCPFCGKTADTGCLPSRCPMWTTAAVYDNATGQWLPVDSDGVALDGSIR